LSTKKIEVRAAGSPGLVVELREKPLDIKGSGHHGEAAIGRAGPLFLRPVAIKLDAVAVRILEVQCFGDTVVRGPIDGIVGLEEPREGEGEIPPPRIQDGEVKEPCRMGRRRVGIAAHPGVESDVVMVSTRREEDSLFAVMLGHLGRC
jgi:hypothetical protein